MASGEVRSTPLPAIKPLQATRDDSIRVHHHRISQLCDSSPRLAPRFATSGRPPNHTAAAQADGALHLQRRPRWWPLGKAEASRKRKAGHRRTPRVAMVWSSAEGNGGAGSSGSHCNRLRPLRPLARAGAFAATIHLPDPRPVGTHLVRSRAGGAEASLFVGQLPWLTERYRRSHARLRRATHSAYP